MLHLRPSSRLVCSIIAAAGLSFAVGALAAETVTVVQKDRVFSVKEISIFKGDTVHFTNEDDFLHQIYTNSAGFSFDSAEQSPGDIIDVEFPVEGTFDVLCGIHPRMVMQVNVK